MTKKKFVMMTVMVDLLVEYQKYCDDTEDFPTLTGFTSWLSDYWDKTVREQFNKEIIKI